MQRLVQTKRARVFSDVVRLVCAPTCDVTSARAALSDEEEDEGADEDERHAHAEAHHREAEEKAEEDEREARRPRQCCSDCGEA